MFERYTDRARRVVVRAQEEARALNRDCIGPEHILMALIQESEGIAVQALTALKITESQLRAELADTAGTAAPDRHIPFTPQSKKVLELALREALQLGDNYVSTEHLLLALLRQGDNAAVTALTGLGADPARVRQQVIKIRQDIAASKGGPRGDALTQLDRIENKLGQVLLVVRELHDHLCGDPDDLSRRLRGLLEP